MLIIAPDNDPHAHVVAKRLESLDAEAIILDSARFPSRCQLSLHLDNDSSGRFVLAGEGFELDQQCLSGVWWRRPRRYVASNEVQEAHLRRFVTEESRAAFEGWLHCLGDRVINPVAADQVASHKLLQLQCAIEVGLRIPASLATNSPNEAHAFIAVNRPQVIYKPFTAAHWQLIATQRVSEDVARHMEAVAYAPLIFQKEIRKVADVRVTMLDGEAFPVLITTQADGAPIDWRVDPARTYVPHVLPEAIKAMLVALIQRLGLRFAACDLALTDDGEYIFFEANTGGQWLFAEIMAGQEISRAFARALLRRGSVPATASIPQDVTRSIP